jgi:hypothetical protein
MITLVNRPYLIAEDLLIGRLTSNERLLAGPASELIARHP